LASRPEDGGRTAPLAFTMSVGAGLGTWPGRGRCFRCWRGFPPLRDQFLQTTQTDRSAKGLSCIR